ncbi:Eco47II family restriction endonuclease [Lactococcus termiticola]|uniref:Uncharacterized protein n=1 Tax=Lactococcus termiticola TaxID=2169526 RepID=A0A2R5HDV9_9LACT|nr:Eco47II family restriction endonuclease [Lactococcus termiticola]GBG96264.1 hypothetical protein NtB2_00375 [Lactococcus termiticola]
MDKFYEIVTGDSKAFYKLCMVLPNIIKQVVSAADKLETPKDTVLEELKAISEKQDISIELAVYLLGFESYNGFNK